MHVIPAVFYLPTERVQWVQGLVVVCVSWPGHPGLPEKKIKKVQRPIVAH
jgi:hypothetical protein